MAKDTTTVLQEVVDGEPSHNAQQVDNLESLVQTAQQTAQQTNTLRTQLLRSANILRYYRASQLLQRALHTAMPAFFLRRPRASPIQENVRIRADAVDKMRSLATARSNHTTVGAQTLCGDRALCDDLARGKFTLLGQTIDLGRPVDWRASGASRPTHLWRFHLHYHEYLLDLAVGSNEEGAVGGAVGGAEALNVWPVIWSIITDWINSNPLEHSQRDDEAWHPYCISRRLPVWAQLFALCEPPADLRDRFLRSFACQAAVLSKTLEFDLGGNHLLENLRALALAGAFLEGSLGERCLDLAASHFQKQLPLQILPHGEHYERAPMYHCQVLGNLLQVAIATACLREDLAQQCCQTASRMRDFLQSILHPDGEIPLFGDSCWGEAHSVEEINAWADLLGLGSATESQEPTTVVGPYWAWRDADDALIFDAGPVGANHLPAHAHCDLLGFEASIAGQRWFVDSGLFDYDESTMRAYCRSSAAHNVVTIDHQNCCDVWSRFRMGRRGQPVRFAHGRQGGFSWCHASHDGYRHLGIPELSRLMVIHKSGVWACLEHGSPARSSSLIGRLHLAPGVEVQQPDPQQPGSSQQLRLAREGVQRWLTVSPGVELGQAEGWYCDRFGQRTRTEVITYRPANASPAGGTFGWLLSPSAISSGAVIIIDDATGQAQVAIDGDPEPFHWQFPN